MKKLHSFALYTLLAPAITLSSAAVLAQQSTGQDLDNEQQLSQRQPAGAQSGPVTTQNDSSALRAGQSDAQTAAERRNPSDQAQTAAERRNTNSQAQTATERHNTSDQSRMENRGFMDAAPANGMHATNLIGAEVKTTDDEEVGDVSDLIINEQGQIVAIVVGVGGFLGMGEKDVAIGWDDVTKSHDSDDHELRITMTREGLRSAPEFKREE